MFGIVPNCPTAHWTLCAAKRRKFALMLVTNRGKGRISRPQNCPAVTPGSRCFGTMPEDLSKFFEPMLDPLLAVDRSLAAQAGPPDVASHAVIPTSYGGVDEVGTRDRQGWIS